LRHFDHHCLVTYWVCHVYMHVVTVRTEWSGDHHPQPDAREHSKHLLNSTNPISQPTDKHKSRTRTTVPHFTRLFLAKASAESPSNGPNPRCEILISAFKNWRPRPEAGAGHHLAPAQTTVTRWAPNIDKVSSLHRVLTGWAALGVYY
jgi:hypothetical protein